VRAETKVSYDSEQPSRVKILAFFFKHSPRVMLFSVFAGACSGACNAALLAVISNVVRRDGSTAIFVFSFAGLCALLPIARFASELFLNRLGQGALCTLRLELCKQILAAPLRHLEEVGAPRLLATLTDDLPAITSAMLLFPTICVNVAIVVGCLIYMGALSMKLLTMVLGFMTIGIATYQIPFLKVRQAFMLARKDLDALQGHFRALTQGAKELKIHVDRQRAFFSDALEKTSDSVRRHNLSGLNLYSAISSWGQTLIFIVIGLILFLLPFYHFVAISMMVPYALTLLYLATPLQVVMNTVPQLIRASVALSKTEELGLTLARLGLEKYTEEGVAPGEWKTLELKSVVHSYHGEDEGETFALGPIDLNFAPGELIFVIGGNGSGKTTFVKLLTGLYAPEKGHIILDGKIIGEANKEFYRRHFSVVFADFYLFDPMLGLAGLESDTQARAYLGHLKLSHKVKILGGKFSTINLSQGQRKRLALLTAYLEDRPIYVFDEWAADQDPQFKSVFYTQLLPDLRAKGKTVFVITHDDRYYRCADRIISLNEGKVVGDSGCDRKKVRAEVK
jgi:putative ATP-binding cassette transporter